jgi:hypothetical protein
LREDFSSIQLETRLFQFVVESISKHKYELPYLKECLKKDKENFVIKLNQKINFEHFNLIIKLFEREYFDEGNIEKLNHWFKGINPEIPINIKKPMNHFVSIIASLIENQIIVNSKKECYQIIQQSFTFKDNYAKLSSIENAMKRNNSNRISYHDKNNYIDVTDFIKKS